MTEQTRLGLPSPERKEPAMGLQTLFLCFVAMAAAAHGQSQSGFISIDCGLPVNGSYEAPYTQILYSPDAGYVETGVNRNVSSDYKMGNLARRYSDLRAFPDGARNCYTLSPVQPGGKYLVRAGFLYGNYDGLSQPPVFDLYLGVNLWQTVTADPADTVLAEIIAVAAAASGSVQVCLVNTGTGTPFISVLELRPLMDAMYTLANESQSLVLHLKRQDHGGEPGGQVRYPDDPYDRVWFSVGNQTGWRPVSTDAGVKTVAGDEFLVPSTVMKTAETTTSLTQTLDFTVPGRVGENIYLFMHFAELQKLGGNDSRQLNVYSNGSLWYGPYSPVYLQAGQLYTSRAGGQETYTYSLAATSNSTLPPILNALEVYSLQEISLFPTYVSDVNVMLNIKRLYRVEKNWIGDPCAPKNFTWEGLDCSNDAFENPRIISLNLSFSGLAGGIPTSIGNLTALRTLDLSHNNLTGEIPTFLAELPVLHSLNLSSNQFIGSLPQLLVNKTQNGSIFLSIDNNPNLCYKVGSCEEVKKKKKILVPIIIVASACLVVLVIILIPKWLLKRRRKPNVLQSKTQASEISMNQPREEGNHQIQKQKSVYQTESYQFTFSEIASITNNFQRAIGKGGFGIVYHGCLPNGTQVAVKMLSEWSSQGTKEFQAEAKILTKVHHKNLVSLLGYCNDKNNLALVYEFMSQGSLVKHLSGNSDDINGLSWRVRLQIAIEAAQGLDYLHNGCTPPIVHRDVKTSNILLNQNFGAKLSDFGLSRAFTSEDITHITTAVAGTPGYLDPEYYQTYQLNEKSDVYSFGVVLLELITSQPPISIGSEKNHITLWLSSRIKRGDITSIVDNKMQGDYDANSIWKVVEIAMGCTSSASFQRPTMSEVLMQLKECLASEEVKNLSRNINTPSPDSIEMLPLNVGSWFSPSTR